MKNKSVLLFGVGDLQKSIIYRAKRLGLFVVGIDPYAQARCRKDVDAFELVPGDDFNKTLEVAKKYDISAIVTAATDKPLLMMTKIARELHLPFFSKDTAIWSTDKYKMKERFVAGGVPCAKGMLISSVEEAKNINFPVICKPRDNSGSRGVKICYSKADLQGCIDEARANSKHDSVLIEEYIEGKEYSIESFHLNGKSRIIQFTEKKTTEFPYNVELGHKQPANLSESEKEAIKTIIDNIALCMKFEYCPSHTELKINDRGIFVIETSPRLGGDFITSLLTPLSTGVNIEDLLLKISLGEPVNISEVQENRSSGISFFSFNEGIINNIHPEMYSIAKMPNVVDFSLKLHKGDRVNKITSSLNRYGYFVVAADSRMQVDKLIDEYSEKAISSIDINR